MKHLVKQMALLIGTVFLVGGCGSAGSVGGPLPSLAAIEGNYSVVVNECEDDGGPIAVDMESSTLTYHGGFDAASGNPYTGPIDAQGDVSFTVGDGSCEGTIKDGVLSGICRFPGEECGFEYRRL